MHAFAATARAAPAVTLKLLWALEGALTGRDWRDVARHDRAELLRALAAFDPALYAAVPEPAKRRR